MKSLNPDRLLPADPGTRQVARRLYEATAQLPILSPHGHVPAQWLADDVPFQDPTSLLVTPDHYVLRLLHAQGLPLDALCVNVDSPTEEMKRHAWRLFCEHWSYFRGTASRYWIADVLANVFGIGEEPAPDTADTLYEQISDALATPEFRPRALAERFRIDVLATTDDPCDQLDHHQKLATAQELRTRVAPTFRPDRYLEPGGKDFPELVKALGAASNIDTGHYDGYLAALEERRRFFKDNGGFSTDHSHQDAVTLQLDPSEARRIFDRAIVGDATSAEATAFRRHMVMEMARMATEDGLVMTLHPGVHRNHHTPTYERYGADTGHDIPVAMEYTRALQPLLERFGTSPGFHLILFTLDETVFSREIAPLAGFYPSVFAGAPWWFLDAPEAVARYRGAVTETAGFYRTSGFIDDTRAFMSIPARHDMSRRLDAAYLAKLVTEHRISEDEATSTAIDLVTSVPSRAFKL